MLGLRADIKMMQELNRNITSMAEAHVSAMIEPITTEINRKNNKDFDWNDIVKDKIVPYLKNPLSGKIGTEEEKQALFEFIQTPTYSHFKRMKVDSPLWFERFLNFDISHKTYRGKKRITMELRFDLDNYEKVPEDYDGDNEILKENIGVYFRIWNNINLYKRNCRFEFREADDCSAEFIRNGGQILNKENVWNAYTKISCEMNEIKKGNICQHVHVYSKMIDLCCCPKWTKDSKYCIMCSHENPRRRSREL